MRHASSATQLLVRLQNADLVRSETAKPGPLLGIRSVRLWSLSAVGRTIVLFGELPDFEDAVALGYSGAGGVLPDEWRRLTLYNGLADWASFLGRPESTRR